MPTTHHPSIGDSVLFEFVLASAYTLLITLGAEHPESLLAAAVAGWIEFTAPAVQVVFALVPGPDGSGEGGLFDAVRIYRHILAACLLFACGHFVRSHRH